MLKILTIAASAMFIASTARAETLADVIEKRAAELHWQQKCSGKQTIDFVASRKISKADATDVLINELERLRAASSTVAGLRKTCDSIQERYRLKGKE